MSKQYLAGTLSPLENYQIESQLLENDFYYEAMEGLEQLPWKQCEDHILQTESRIEDEFGINKQGPLRKNLAFTVIGLLLVGFLGAWYFTAGTPETVDLTPDQKKPIGTAPLQEPDKKGPITPSTPEEIPEADTVNRNTATAAKKETLPTSVKRKSRPTGTVSAHNNASIHITVGRIVDTKGLAIANAVVTLGAVADTTDNSGYFALEAANGGTRIVINHLGTPYRIDVDTNQNWEIILDIANRKVHDYNPINAANRFK